MQKNVPKYTPPWVRTVTLVGGGVAARRLLRAVQRPAHAAVVRQPAGGRVPPDAGPGRPAGPAHPPGARPRPARGRRVRAGGPRRATLVRQALTDVGLDGRGQDQRRQGPARVRPDRRPRVDRGRRPPPPGRIAARAERLDPALATTAFVREDRGGKVFVDSTRAGGATVVAAYSPRVRPGVPVSFPVAWDDLDRRGAGRLHRAHRAPPTAATATRGRRRCRRRSGCPPI